MSKIKPVLLAVKKLLIKIIDIFFHMKNFLVSKTLIAWDFFYSRIVKPPIVKSVPETVDYIVETGCSVSRYGDGEIKLVGGHDLAFQAATPFVVKKLREVLCSDLEGHIVGLADIFGECDNYTESAYNHWFKKHLPRYRHLWYKYTKKGKVYYNASITRQYITLRDRSGCKAGFESLKRIWDGKDIVFIEGEKSRMGVGNDLFDNAKSIRRILGPSEQAFSKYDELMNEACKLEKDVLILLALGPCATSLAYDLHKKGYHAVDIGHVDIEYEWFLAGTKYKIPIKDKLVMEARGNEQIGDEGDENYLNQIIARVI